MSEEGQGRVLDFLMSVIDYSLMSLMDRMVYKYSRTILKRISQVRRLGKPIIPKKKKD